MPSPHQVRARGAAAETSHVRRVLDIETVEADIAQKLPLLDALSAARIQRSRSGSNATLPTGLRLLAQADSWLDHRPTDLADCLRGDGGHAVTSLAISARRSIKSPTVHCRATTWGSLAPITFRAPRISSTRRLVPGKLLPESSANGSSTARPGFHRFHLRRSVTQNVRRQRRSQTSWTAMRARS